MSQEWRCTVYVQGVQCTVYTTGETCTDRKDERKRMKHSHKMRLSVALTTHVSVRVQSTWLRTVRVHVKNKDMQGKKYADKRQ